jgi:uncharacterized membrane protein YkoI
MMRTPTKKTMILAGAFSAGLIAVGGTLAVAGTSSDGAATPTPTATTSASANSTQNVSTGVSRDQARQIALAVVPGARVVDIELDSADRGDDNSSDRVTRWEVDLVQGNVSYDVDIDAQNGDVLKNRSEVDDRSRYDDRHGVDDHGGWHGGDDH